jgi:lipopolysaccharide exporter
MEVSITEQTAYGIKWNYLSAITNAVIQIGYAAIMARLLDPESFGLMAMAAVVLRFGSYFAEMGIGSAIVQKKEINRIDIRTGFTLSLIFSSTFFLLIFFLAPLSKLLLSNNEIVPIVKVVALSLILSGVATTPLGLLRRGLEFRALALIEIFSYLLGYCCVGLLLAFQGYGVWSLVGAMLAQNVLITVTAFWLRSDAIGFAWTRINQVNLIKYGGKLSFVYFLEFIGLQLDTMIIGRLRGSQQLGVYNRGSMISYLPVNNVVSNVFKVLFPSYSRMQDDIVRLREAYSSVVVILSAIIVPFCLCMAVASNEIVQVLLGPKWVEASKVVRYLSLATMIGTIHFGGPICDATGLLRGKIIIQSVYIVALGFALIVSARFGLVGLSIAMLIVQIVKSYAYFVLMNQILKANWFDFIQCYLPGILIGIVSSASVLITKNVLFYLQLPIGIIFTMEIIVGVIAVFVFWVVVPPAFLKKHLKQRLSALRQHEATHFGRMLIWYGKRLI